MVTWNSTSVHFVGIGGAGMSGIARVMLQKGCKVSGSDLNMTSVTDSLAKMGAQIFNGHRAENVPHDAESVVVSTAISDSNPEVIEAKDRGIPIIHRGEMLANIMEGSKGIAVAGAHGKTTITSMIAICLEESGLDPTVVIGGELPNLGSNAKLGQGEYFVAEADESDGSFLKLNPYIAVVSNVEDDHLDYYETVENIVLAFKKYISNVCPEGFSILCADDPLLRELAVTNGQKIITYGMHPSAQYRVENIVSKGFSTVGTVYVGEKKLGKLELKVPGHHNMVNALAAVVVSCELGLSFQEVAEALKKFVGAKRRFQLLGEARGVMVVDDYAHHPTEIMATLKGARQGNPLRIIAVFQPHRFSRTKRLHAEFARAFNDADILIVNDIYGAGEKPIPGVTSSALVEEIKVNSSCITYFIAEGEATVRFLEQELCHGDMVMVLGAGDVYKVGLSLLEVLEDESMSG